MERPLILTLRIDMAAQGFYDELRARYFPPERNAISAHLTLFHQLPDQTRTHRTVQTLAEETSEFGLGDAELRLIGRGVAVFFRSEQLAVLHAALSSAFQADLIAQDRQRLRPHIVVQNKVDAATAQATLAELRAWPLVAPRAAGLTVWRYLGGPWSRLADYAFGACD